ncbi:hypothetical protein IEI94_02365 [Halomonas sp. ML-15]|uniref:hypothetical protein n=1 Tax=Halomonas sp. ML-15 TaxID=2773305 RepID=UPI001747BDDD|nr:hypothetical protein [Halomonas sp. ML-15]MBD3894700.1 hypothetical protein [Halomonas sp. ML-15]
MELNQVQCPVDGMGVVAPSSEPDSGCMLGQKDAALAEQARTTVESLLQTSPDDRKARDEARNAIERMDRSHHVSPVLEVEVS